MSSFINQIQLEMQNHNGRLKTEGALVDRNYDINLQKYGQQLKSQLEQISKLLKKKKTLRQEPQIPVIFKKQSYGNQTSLRATKNISHQLEESIDRKNKDRERENRRNHIYNTQSFKQTEDEIYKQEAQKQFSQKEHFKSPFSQSMSTSSSRGKSHTKEGNKQQIEISDFILGKKLGQGKFGEVFVAQHRKSGFICAIKRIFRSVLDEKMMLQLARQIKIQTYLNHPNIVKLYTFFCDKKAIYLVQELCISGQLFNLLKKKRRIPQELTRIIVQQICRALDFMHECEIIHRDLKPQNIIYHNGLVKICDFGWSISSKAMRHTFCGTPLYVSPELLKKRSYNNKIDVWSIGVLTYQLLFGRVPFEIITEKDFIKIVEDQIRFSKTMAISQQAKDFINICLNKDPRDRFTVPELLQHPFISLIENPVLAELY